MSRVFTTQNEAMFTLNVVDKDGSVQLLLRVEGPLPNKLDDLSQQASAGDKEVAKEYVGEFIRYWHSQQSSDWANIRGPRH